MGKVRHGRYGCRSCGREAPEVGYLSCTGRCLPCAFALVEENVRGLADPQSVAYKRWWDAYSQSRPGCPRITTPPPGWTPSAYALTSK